MSDYAISFLLGVIEGLTEFLPVSSTAHLRIGEALFGLSLQDPFWAMFSVVIQLGAILAVIVYFRRELVGFVRSFPRGESGTHTLLTHPLSLTLLAFVVTAVPAFLLSKIIGKNLESLTVIGSSLLAGGVVMWVVDVLARTPRTDAVDKMTVPQSVGIGAAQILSALFPGTSRSMATIAAGQVMGLTREAALEFSFYLSIPTMVVATSYELVHKVLRPQAGEAMVQMTPHLWGVLALGFGVSLVVALAVIAWFMHWVRRHGFVPFAVYRIILGVFVLGSQVAGLPWTKT